jgi:hypothetical protein
LALRYRSPQRETAPAGRLEFRPVSADGELLDLMTQAMDGRSPETRILAAHHVPRIRAGSRPPGE